MGAGNSAVVVDLPRWGPMLSPRVPNLVPIPGPRMERETPGQRPRPNYGHPQATAADFMAGPLSVTTAMGCISPVSASTQSLMRWRPSSALGLSLGGVESGAQVRRCLRRRHRTGQHHLGDVVDDAAELPGPSAPVSNWEKSACHIRFRRVGGSANAARRAWESRRRWA